VASGVVLLHRVTPYCIALRPSANDHELQVPCRHARMVSANALLGSAGASLPHHWQGPSRASRRQVSRIRQSCSKRARMSVYLLVNRAIFASCASTPCTQPCACGSLTLESVAHTYDFFPALASSNLFRFCSTVSSCSGESQQCQHRARFGRW